MNNDFPYSEEWRKWLASDVGRTASDYNDLPLSVPGWLETRLLAAFDAGWKARPTVEYAPYESTVIAISTEAGYLALHERIQEGWEPLLCWTDDHGEHMTMRRLRI